MDWAASHHSQLVDVFSLIETLNRAVSAEASNAMGKHCSNQSGRAVLLEAEGLGLPFVDHFPAMFVFHCQVSLLEGIQCSTYIG